MPSKLRIGTRESQLALWQAEHVSRLLKLAGIDSELVLIKSEGDLDLTTPLYEMGVQGIFTRSLDIALLNNRIDLAVHSMKDVPVKLPRGLQEAAVLERDSPFDLFIPAPGRHIFDMQSHPPATIASSSLRRKAQWLHRFPKDNIVPIRGNVNTRMKKVEGSDWSGAIFAAAGLERIGLRPVNAIPLHWMLPAPAQGAILVVCRESDENAWVSTRSLHHENTAFCTRTERDFLSGLMGGCSTPVGALAIVAGEEVFFRGNLLDPSGERIFSVEKRISLELASGLGTVCAHQILEAGGREILNKIAHA